MLLCSLLLILNLEINHTSILNIALVFPIIDIAWDSQGHKVVPIYYH